MIQKNIQYFCYTPKLSSTSTSSFPPEMGEIKMIRQGDPWLQANNEQPTDPAPKSQVVTFFVHSKGCMFDVFCSNTGRFVIFFGGGRGDFVDFFTTL